MTDTAEKILQNSIGVIDRFGWYCGSGSDTLGGVEVHGGCMMECLAMGAGHHAGYWGAIIDAAEGKTLDNFDPQPELLVAFDALRRAVKDTEWYAKRLENIRQDMDNNPDFHDEGDTAEGIADSGEIVYEWNDSPSTGGCTGPDEARAMFQKAIKLLPAAV